jgi:uncharacterized membrane protein
MKNRKIRTKKLVSFAAVVLLIAPVFVFAQGVTFPTGTGLPSSSGGIATIIQNFMNWILKIFSFLAIISFVISGVMYFMAFGDDRQVEKAKNQMTWSIIGVIVGLSGLVVITAIESWFSGSSTF